MSPWELEGSCAVQLADEDWTAGLLVAVFAAPCTSVDAILVAVAGESPRKRMGCIIRQ